MNVPRCPWASTPAEIAEHDQEWGRPLHDDRALFELLVLDMIHMFPNCLSYEVVRDYEFAPIKNKTGVDSVESARALLQKNGVAL